MNVMHFIKIACIKMKFILNVAWGRKGLLKRVVYLYMAISIGDEFCLDLTCTLL